MAAQDTHASVHSAFSSYQRCILCSFASMDCSALLILLSALVAVIIDLVDGACTVPLDQAAFNITSTMNFVTREDKFYIYVTHYDIPPTHAESMYLYFGRASSFCRDFGGYLATPSTRGLSGLISLKVEQIATQMETDNIGMLLPNMWLTGYEAKLTKESPQEKKCSPKSKQVVGSGTCPRLNRIYMKEFNMVDLVLNAYRNVVIQYGDQLENWRGIDPITPQRLPFVCEIPCNETSELFGFTHTIQAELNFGAPGVECNEDTVITCGASVAFTDPISDSTVGKRFTLFLNEENVGKLNDTVRLPVHGGLRNYSCTAKLFYNSLVLISESKITTEKKCVNKALNDVKAELEENDKEIQSELAKNNKEMKSELAKNNNEMKSDLTKNNDQMKSEFAKNQEENKAANKTTMIIASIAVTFAVICMIIGIVIIVLLILGRKANKGSTGPTEAPKAPRAPEAPTGTKGSAPATPNVKKERPASVVNVAESKETLKGRPSVVNAEESKETLKGRPSVISAQGSKEGK